MSLPRPSRRRAAPAVALVATLAWLAACHPAPHSAGRVAAPVPVVHVPGCSRPAVLDSRVTITRFHSPDGSCIASNGLLGVRCGAELDPVLLVGAASRRPTVFVGGRFGVPLPSPPRDARLVGRSQVGNVFASSNEPRSLFVESEGAVRRWLQLPAPARVSTPPRVFLMGDSILFGSETFVNDELDGWSATFDAAIGRASLAGVAVAAAHGDPPPDIAVVELGTNDADPAAFAENARAILDSFGAADLVVWVNVHSPAVGSAAINREIRAAVASRTNAVIADWSARAPEEEFSGDGIHLSPGHEGAFAAFLAPVLRAWRAAVDGAGSARCVPSVEAAVRA